MASSDESVVSVSDVTAGEVGSEAGDKADGTFTITAVSEGTAEITVDAQLLNWVETSVTYEVSVGKDPNSDNSKTAKIVDFDAYTDHSGEKMMDEATDLQTLYASLTFDQPMKIVDEEALIKEMDESISFGFDGPVGNLSLSADGKTLSFTLSEWWAGTAGIFNSTGVWKNLVTADGGYADANVKFIVPNGLEAVIVDQVVADGENNASVTTQIVNPGNATRGMVHLVVLKNGQPITTPNSNGAMITGHFHAYLTLTAEDFVNMYADSIREALGDDYELSTDENMFTITAKNSEEGDILEFHISSYLNNGSKTISTGELESLIAEAEAVDSGVYTKDSYADLTAALDAAKMIVKDTTYYAQTDVDNAADKLQATIDSLEKLTAAKIVDFDAYTDHSDEKMMDETTDLQTLYASLTFDQPMKIVDEEALIKEMDESISFGFDGPVGNLSLSADGKTLSFTLSEWWAGTAGIFNSTGVWKNLVTADGGYADANVKFIVPNGLEAVIVDQVVADGENNASVTTQIVNPGNATRGMVHLVVLKNGQPITTPNSNGAMITGHFHAYLTLTAEDFVNMYADSIREALGDDYELSTDENMFTITAKNSEEGDILEFHISSYLNNGSKTISTGELESLIAEAEAVDSGVYTKDSYADLTAALDAAKMIVKDTTYYAQTDVDNAADKLQAAITALIKVGSEDENNEPTIPDQNQGDQNQGDQNVQNGNNNDVTNDAQNTVEDDAAAATGDEMPIGILLALLLASAGAVGVAIRKKTV